MQIHEPGSVADQAAEKAKTMDSYRACSIAEGFAQDESALTQADYYAAWSVLIRTGLAWSLQGWYGRRAMEYIDGGLFNRKGEILSTEYEFSWD